MTQYLTPAEVAKRLCVTEHSVRRWVKEGTIPGRKVGGRVRIPADFEMDLPSPHADKAQEVQ